MPSSACRQGSEYQNLSSLCGSKGSPCFGTGSSSKRICSILYARKRPLSVDPRVGAGRVPKLRERPREESGKWCRRRNWFGSCWSLSSLLPRKAVADCRPSLCSDWLKGSSRTAQSSQAASWQPRLLELERARWRRRLPAEWSLPCWAWCLWPMETAVAGQEEPHHSTWRSTDASRAGYPVHADPWRRSRFETSASEGTAIDWWPGSPVSWSSSASSPPQSQFFVMLAWCFGFCRFKTTLRTWYPCTRYPRALDRWPAGTCSCRGSIQGHHLGHDCFCWQGRIFAWQ